MSNWQHEFPLQQGLIYLNHAAVSPWPVRTATVVSDFAKENSTQGSMRYLEWLKVETSLRKQLALLINVPSQHDVALLKSTSEALSTVAYGLDWNKGDNIVISNQEFPSNRIVWESLSQFGVEVRAVDLDEEETPEASLLAHTDNNTRLLSISSVQYSTGLKMNLAALGSFCKQQNILFCVDAIQSIGAVKFDAQAIQADFVMADGHKWMMGPEGVALFYTTAEARSKLKLNQYGWHMVKNVGDYTETEWEVTPTARRFECGSPNMLGIHALQASLSLLLEIGMDKVEQRVLDNSRFMVETIKQSAELELLTRPDSDRLAGIVTFSHKYLNNDELFAKLTENNIFCAPRGGGIRFSPHFYTDRDLLNKALQIISA